MSLNLADPLFFGLDYFYTGSAKNYGSCPLDKILSSGYLTNHCLLLNNQFYPLASCPLDKYLSRDNFIQYFEQPSPGLLISRPAIQIISCHWSLVTLMASITLKLEIMDTTDTARSASYPDIHLDIYSEGWLRSQWNLKKRQIMSIFSLWNFHL